MKSPALSKNAISFLLQIAAGARVEWYREQGHLGYRLNGRRVDHGTALSELRSAKLVDFTSQGGSLPLLGSLCVEGSELARALRASGPEDTQLSPDSAE